MRYPAVSGSFYPASPTALGRQVKELLAKAREEMEKNSKTNGPPSKSNSNAQAIVVPHAGYAYSGLTAAYSFAAVQEQLQRPNTTVIILGPNHTSAGQLVSVSLDDWNTPVGKSVTDLPLAGALVRGAVSGKAENGQAPSRGANSGDKGKLASIITRNEAAHFREHSIEVQLPFLQTINPVAKIVAICLMAQDITTSKLVGQTIFDVTRMPAFANRNILVIASSDFTHYMSAAQAEKLDRQPLEFIRQLDDDEFQDEVEGKQLSICGHGAIAAAMHYAKLAGAKKATLLKYTNSGKETGKDKKEVVAYASLVMD